MKLTNYCQGLPMTNLMTGLISMILWALLLNQSAVITCNTRSNKGCRDAALRFCNFECFNRSCTEDCMYEPRPGSGPAIVVSAITNDFGRYMGVENIQVNLRGKMGLTWQNYSPN